MEHNTHALFQFTLTHQDINNSGLVLKLSNTPMNTFLNCIIDFFIIIKCGKKKKIVIMKNEKSSLNDTLTDYFNILL